MLKQFTQRKVFFSFHFQRDVWRVSQIRNCNVITTTYAQSDFVDAAAWETVMRQGDSNIKKWIDTQIHGTSITIVLIGQETSTREYVLYEIEKSYNKGNALIGIYIHNMQDQYQKTNFQGANPFDQFILNDNERDKLSLYVPTYNWVTDNGRINIGRWIDKAINNKTNNKRIPQIVQ